MLLQDEADLFWSFQKELPFFLSTFMMGMSAVFFFLQWIMVLPVSHYSAVDGRKELDTARLKWASGFMRVLASVGMLTVTVLTLRQNDWRFYPAISPSGQMFSWSAPLALFCVALFCFYVADSFSALKRAPSEEIEHITGPTVQRNAAYAAVALAFFLYPIHGTLGGLLIMNLASVSYIVEFAMDVIGDLSLETVTTHHKAISLTFFTNTVMGFVRLAISIAAAGFSFKWYLDNRVIEIKALGDKDSADQAVRAHAYRPIAIALAATGLLLGAWLELQVTRAKSSGTTELLRRHRLLTGAMLEEKGLLGLRPKKAGPTSKKGSSQKAAAGSGKKNK